MGKRSKVESTESVQTETAQVEGTESVQTETAPAAPVKATPIYTKGQVSNKLRADYVKAAWAATEAILPATEAQIAALPEFKPELLKGGRVSGYLNYWCSRGFLVKQG